MVRLYYPLLLGVTTSASPVPPSLLYRAKNAPVATNTVHVTTPGASFAMRREAEIWITSSPQPVVVMNMKLVRTESEQPGFCFFAGGEIFDNAEARGRRVSWQVPVATVVFAEIPILTSAPQSQFQAVPGPCGQCDRALYYPMEERDDDRSSDSTQSSAGVDGAGQLLQL